MLDLVWRARSSSFTTRSIYHPHLLFSKPIQATPRPTGRPAGHADLPSASLLYTTSSPLTYCFVRQIDWIGSAMHNNNKTRLKSPVSNQRPTDGPTERTTDRTTERTTERTNEGRNDGTNTGTTERRNERRNAEKIDCHTAVRSSVRPFVRPSVRPSSELDAVRC